MISNIYTPIIHLIHLHFLILSWIQVIYKLWNHKTSFDKVRLFSQQSAFKYFSKRKHSCSNISTYHVHILLNITVIHSCYHHSIIPVISKNSSSSSHFFILQNQIIFKIKPSYKLTYTLHNLSKFIIIETKSYPHHFIQEK
jgi:hypothetical protein